MSATSIQAGKEYIELSNPVPVSLPGKIEVVEMFWYGDPHSYHFEPTLGPWSEKLPTDVNFLRLPAMFGGPWDAHGQMFLTLDTIGVNHGIHGAVFDAVQNQRRQLTNPNEMADFVATQGVDKQKFLATFSSFVVKGRMVQCKEMARKYEITGVPAMIVNGKYRFDLGTAGGPERILQVADALIEKERQANK